MKKVIEFINKNGLLLLSASLCCICISDLSQLSQVQIKMIICCYFVAGYVSREPYIRKLRELLDRSICYNIKLAGKEFAKKSKENSVFDGESDNGDDIKTEA